MSNSVDVNALFGAAQNDGLLSQAANNVLTGIQDLGAQINAGLGTPADQIQSAQTILFAGIYDNSGSIGYSGNTDTVIQGHNGVIDALRASKQAGDVLLYSRLLDGQLINPFSPLSAVTLFDRRNYVPNGNTPLFRETLVVCATILAKTQEFADQGIPVRSVTLIVTDGLDNASGRSTARDCKKVIEDMLRSEQHIVAAMGIGASQREQDEFRRVFGEMGILDQWILTPGNSPSEIRKAFAVASQSAVRASQAATGAAFSQAAVGGFGSP